MYEYVFDVASVADVRTNLLLRVLSHSNNVRNIGIPYHPILRAPFYSPHVLGSYSRSLDELTEPTTHSSLWTGTTLVGT